MCETDESDKNVANKGENSSIFIYIFIYQVEKIK